MILVRKDAIGGWSRQGQSPVNVPATTLASLVNAGSKQTSLPEQTNHLALFLILSYAFSAPEKIANPTKSGERDEDARRESDQSEQELLALQEGVNATDGDLNVYLRLLNLYQ